MRIVLANHSSYPAAAVASDSEPSADRRARIAEVVSDQEAAGLDLVTDGQAAATDPISHLMRQLGGVRLAGPQRLADTGIRYLQPVVEAKIRRRQTSLVDEFLLARQVAARPVKAVLVGPYTLARRSIIATTAYRDAADLAADLSGVLAAEIGDLVRAGAAVIQIDEPAILRRPEDIRLLRELLEPLRDAAGDAAQLAVATYGSDAEPLYAQLNSLPADIIALDCTVGPQVIDAIADTGSGKVLALGLIGGADAPLPSPDHVAQLLGRALHRYVHDRIYLQPSCGLGHLPRARARATLDVLAAARAHLIGELHAQAS